MSRTRDALTILFALALSACGSTSRSESDAAPAPSTSVAPKASPTMPAPAPTTAAPPLTEPMPTDPPATEPATTEPLSEAEKPAEEDSECTQADLALGAAGYDVLHFSGQDDTLAPPEWHSFTPVIATWATCFGYSEAAATEIWRNGADQRAIGFLEAHGLRPQLVCAKFLALMVAIDDVATDEAEFVYLMAKYQTSIDYEADYAYCGLVSDEGQRVVYDVAEAIGATEPPVEPGAPPAPVDVPLPPILSSDQVLRTMTDGIATSRAFPGWLG